jgi:hypothetical protein
MGKASSAGTPSAKAPASTPGTAMPVSAWARRDRVEGGGCVPSPAGVAVATWAITVPRREVASSPSPISCS